MSIVGAQVREILRDISDQKRLNVGVVCTLSFRILVRSVLSWVLGTRLGDRRICEVMY